MAVAPRSKASFGTVAIDHFSPAPGGPKWPAPPPAVNVVLGFEEALKLHLAIGEALSAINKMNRSTKEGKGLR